MHLWLIAVLAVAVQLEKASDAYAPLRLYEGTWQVSRKDLPKGGKPDVLVNHCGLLGQYFACAQNVNGAQGGLVVFIPAGGQSGHFYTQTILPEGRATGRDDLQIVGNQWTYMSRRDQDGQTTFFRNTNTFADKNHIHFESAESNDGKSWNVKGAGDETRMPSRATH